MKKISFLLCALFVVSSSVAQTKEIHFEKTSFADIKAKAKKEDKLIFIDAYTSWCGPCKWMAKNVFTNDTVADYFNAKFVNAKFDMEQEEGPEIAKLYNVRCYPNLLFIDGDGKLVHRGAGGKEAREFIDLAENAFKTEKRYSRYMEQYASKKSDPAFLLEYIEIMSHSCMPPDEVLKDYFGTQKDEALTSRINWETIRDYSNDPKSREFNYLLNNIDAYKKRYTADSVDSKIQQVLINGGYKTFYKKDAVEKEYTNYIESIKTLKYTGTGKVIFVLGMAYHKKAGDWAKYSQLVAEQGDEFLKDPQEVNNVSWNLYEHSDDKNALLKAEGWMKKAVDQAHDWYIFDTYAAILYKLHKKAEAKAAALKAIEIAKKDGVGEDEYKETKELLEKIEKL